MGVHWALEVLKNNPDISADLIDLRTLVPLDRNMVLDSVKKTGRAIVLHEDCMIGGFGADISAMIADDCFEYLDAPVKRSASIDTPVPFAYELEDEFLAKSRFELQLKELLAY
jgi:2-oxoisovalerate dehydrogenase E1 component